MLGARNGSRVGLACLGMSRLLRALYQSTLFATSPCVSPILQQRNPYWKRSRLTRVTRENHTARKPLAARLGENWLAAATHMEYRCRNRLMACVFGLRKRRTMHAYMGDAVTEIRIPMLKGAP
ncbi:hypothetical protein K491DRAFT_135597 [Lophiostoma macrostomum CBS 122681]|uniref:Uncharacterized protein n=1 Tax=Lophiostoma macrostomum CBS 122681 TaxID=1314788 RepID=A0A6A6TIE2_9PLEO|nr:hypothetical protein K491DRAFT_135597 [Lophiostoma macrostomum CBS 122681]